MLVIFAPGCAWLCKSSPEPPPPCSQYHAQNLSAAVGQRILLVPLANETAFPQAPEQIRNALAAALQSIGQIEVVVPSCDGDACLSQIVHSCGAFDESAMLAATRAFHIDTVLVGTVTQFKPYAPQCVGLSLRLVSPPAAAIIASLDGLWDARDPQLAGIAQGNCGPNSIFPSAALNPDSNCAALKADLNLLSPQQFQRFVCRQAVQVLLTPPGEASNGTRAETRKEDRMPGQPSAGPGNANEVGPEILPSPARVDPKAALKEAPKIPDSGPNLELSSGEHLELR